MKNILTLKIQCFCTHQEEAASQRNYHISEYLKEIKQKKKKQITIYCLRYLSKCSHTLEWRGNILQEYLIYNAKLNSLCKISDRNTNNRQSRIVNNCS